MVAMTVDLTEDNMATEAMIAREEDIITIREDMAMGGDMITQEENPLTREGMIAAI
jgi:hypothetical protein